MVIVDERLVVLERERHAGVAGVAGTFDQGFAAPAPDLLGREFFVHDRPVTLGDVVGGELGMARHAPPGQEHAQVGRTEVGGHANQLAHVADLGLANLGHRVEKSLLAATA